MIVSFGVSSVNYIPKRSKIPNSHKFMYYHWIRGYINQAGVEIVRVGIRYSLFQKQEENHRHQQ